MERPCGSMALVPNPPTNFANDFLAIKPADIPLRYYTHINFAFALIDPKTFRIAPIDPNTASRCAAVTNLKARQSGLEVWIAIGKQHHAI